MLTEVDSHIFHGSFPADPHPFLSDGFIQLNAKKADRIIHVMEEINKPGMGLISGVVRNTLISHFSAPFGGFHFRKEILHTQEIDDFLNHLKDYIISGGFEGIEFKLPPDIYHQTFNAKLVNALIRQGFRPELPEITNWVRLQEFGEKFTQKNSKEYYRQALRNELSVQVSDIDSDKKLIYSLIRENRAKFGRPIYMSLEDIEETADLWPVDYFKITDRSKNIVAAAIMYRYHPEIVYALFWGDNDNGRPLRAMDFLTFNLWTHYRDLGYRYLDLGVSTEDGIPNEGLLRFKESHEAVSSIKYRFSWWKD